MILPSLPCPHCQTPISGTAFKGLYGVKQCPSCHKRVKFKRASAKTVFRALWKPFLIFMVMLILYTALLIALFGNDVPPILLIVPISLYMVFVQAPKQIKLSSFEKDE